MFTSSAGRLACKKIIHAVGPKWYGGNQQEERKLINCIDNCFEEVEKHHLTSIAIPPVSTGIFEYPMAKAVKAIVDAVCDRENQGESLPHFITFVDNKETSLKFFEEELAKRVWKGQAQVIPLPVVTSIPAVTPRRSLQPSGTLRVISCWKNYLLFCKTKIIIDCKIVMLNAACKLVHSFMLVQICFYLFVQALRL